MKKLLSHHIIMELYLQLSSESKPSGRGFIGFDVKEVWYQPACKLVGSCLRRTAHLLHQGDAAAFQISAPRQGHGRRGCQGTRASSFPHPRPPPGLEPGPRERSHSGQSWRTLSAAESAPNTLLNAWLRKSVTGDWSPIMVVGPKGGLVSWRWSSNHSCDLLVLHCYDWKSKENLVTFCTKNKQASMQANK
jgi:hypothetical protein